MTALFKFGENTDIDTATVPEDVWLEGGAYPFIDVAGQLTVESSSSDDDGDPAGAGANSAHAVYLDSNFAEIEATATLDGTVAVNIGTISCYRINRAWIVNSGANSENVGTILYKVGGTIVARIDPLEGEAAQAIYTVPAQYEYGEIDSYFANLGKATGSSNVRVELQFRPNGETWRITFVDYNQSDGSSDVQRAFLAGSGPRYLPGTDIRVRVTESSANDIQVGAGFNILQVRGATYTLP